MAESSVEPDLEWSNRALDSTDDILVAMETLLATLRAFEDVLRHQEISVTSSSEYCDNFCQALMHYAGSRNSVEHGLPLLEVYCLSIDCFAAARSHLTAESDSVALVLKRLALSCFELLLSVPENEIPYEAWVQFHNSVQIAHENLLQFGSTDLQALLQITGEGGAWSNAVLTALLTGQSTIPQEVNSYIGLEGEGFMEMRVKHLEKIGEIAKAVVLAKSCSDCCLISNQATFRQTYVSLLCLLLPNEEAITEISRLHCKDVLEITPNLEKEGEANTAFILCTTFLTQQLQQQNLYSSWELTLLWSKLQRKIDPSPESLLERCLQLGAIANTVQHLLYLVRVIRTETKEHGLASSVELCVKALQLPKQNDSESRISVLKTVSGLLKDDLEVMRACLLTEFLLGPCQEVFSCLQEFHLHPDQKYDQENGLIPNSLRCELLLALKAYWPFDPEFWDWKTLKRHCSRILGMTPEEEEVDEKHEMVKHEAQYEESMYVESRQQHHLNGAADGKAERRGDKGPYGMMGNQRCSQTKKKLFCKICKKSVTGGQIIPHSRRHADDRSHPCPVCMRVFDSRKDIVSHMKHHLRSFANSLKKHEKDNWPQPLDGEDDIEPGEIKADPSLILYYKSTHDPDVLHHIVQQSKDEDELVTFDYIDLHFNLQNRDEYPCPGTECLRNFKHSKYLYVHLKSDHQGDENVKHFHEMRDKREKCIFCRRHFVSNYHHRKHRRTHYNDEPYVCTVIGCGAQFKTSNELAAHKHSHGYQLNFQCQLKGCYVTFSDLGQLYHHEAQHFREAAFTCTSPECKKFYLSKKEFIEHLSTHGITFSEEDFETQRKAKKDLFGRGEKVTSKQREEEEEEEEENGGGSTSSRCASSWDASSCKGPKGTITSVAVCFDGSKFTCGFERCGMTFSRARDVQRHFKCAHPEHLKLENKDDRHDKERDSKSKGLKVETKQTNEQKGKRESSTPFPLKAEKENNKSSRLNCNENNSTSLCQNDALKEILIGLSKLDLNSVDNSNGPLESSNVSHLSYCEAIMARSPVVVLQKRPPHMFVDRVKVKKEKATEDVNINVGESLATAKPYVCKINGCDFRTAQSFSLLRHHVIIHNYTMEQAKKLTSIDSFKPFLCQICSKSHKEKINLRLHYIQAHKLGKAAIEKINCASVKQVKSRVTDGQQLKDGPQVRKRAALSWQQRYQKRKKAVVLRRETRKEIVFDNQSASEEEDEVEEETEQANGTSDDTSERKEEKRDGPSQVRTTRRHNAKSNLCYILTKFNKPFHCVVKDCNSAFSTQGGLVRHLQLFHHYNRSQLVLDKDPDLPRHPDAKKDAAKKKPLSNSDEPQPQFQCRFANCQASYHLKSSLVRHTQELHCQPPEPIQCPYEGCTRVFNHASALKKHILYTHCEYYDSLVLRLQSTHKKPLDECQKETLDVSNGIKEEPHAPVSEVVTPISEVVTPISELVTPISELVTPVSALAPPALLTEEAAPSVDTEDKYVIEEIRKRKPKKFKVDSFILRSHDEALQMCQTRHLRSHYPCMIRDCDSVVKYLNSLQRHYFNIHHVCRADLYNNGDKLVLNFEQLEELTERKSALPAVAAECTSNGVHKMKYQAEHESPDGTPVAMSLNFIKSEMLDDPDPDPLNFQSGELSPVERNVLVGADDVLYGEPSTGGPKEEPTPEIQNGYNNEERSKYPNTIPLIPVVTVDLSSPSSLRIASEEGFQDSSCSKDGGKSMNESVTNPAVRLPLKRKNELSEPCNLPDAHSHLPFNTFDIGAYKPMGFESSFLQFIQETDIEGEFAQIKRKDSLRRSCSVKENNQLGVALTRSKRTRSPTLKPSAPAEDLTTDQTLKSIMDKALAGCGALAIQQLQYLRPVVVLERPMGTVSTALPHLVTPDANNKLVGN